MKTKKESFTKRFLGCGITTTAFSLHNDSKEILNQRNDILESYIQNELHVNPQEYKFLNPIHNKKQKTRTNIDFNNVHHDDNNNCNSNNIKNLKGQNGTIILDKQNEFYFVIEYNGNNLEIPYYDLTSDLLYKGRNGNLLIKGNKDENFFFKVKLIIPFIEQTNMEMYTFQIQGFFFSTLIESTTTPSTKLRNKKIPKIITFEGKILGNNCIPLLINFNKTIFLFAIKTLII